MGYSPWGGKELDTTSPTKHRQHHLTRDQGKADKVIYCPFKGITKQHAEVPLSPYLHQLLADCYHYTIVGLASCSPHWQLLLHASSIQPVVQPVSGCEAILLKLLWKVVQPLLAVGCEWKCCVLFPPVQDLPLLSVPVPVTEEPTWFRWCRDEQPLRWAGSLTDCEYSVDEC